MKTQENEILPLTHESDRSAINAALAQLAANSRLQAKHLTIVAPEIKSITADATNYYTAVDLAISDFLKKPSNAHTSLAIALNGLAAERAKVFAISGALIADGNAVSALLKQVSARLVEETTTRLTIQLQVFFSGTSLASAVRKNHVFLAVKLFSNKFSGLTFGRDLSKASKEGGWSDVQNTALEVMNLYQAQTHTFDAAREEFDELRSMISALE